MTPDTTNYMITGFAVIFAGIFIYILTLLIRTKSVKARSKAMQELLEDSIDISEKIGM